jgi:hypothetical protein
MKYRMSWMFITDIVFYALLGLFTFPVVVVIVAQVTDNTFEQGYRAVKRFLNRWASIPGKDFMDVVLKVSGVSTVLLLLAFGGYLANRLGDALLPHSAGLFGYFGSDEVRWVVQFDEEYDCVVWNLREVTGIRGDRVKWEEAKVGMGRYDVRFFRATSVIFGVLLINSLLAIIRWRRTKYGIAFGITFLLVIASHWLWVDREEKFTENLIGRFISEYIAKHNHSPSKPGNFGGLWSGPVCESYVPASKK